MLVSYFDAGGSTADPKISGLTVAGMVADADRWTKFAGEWEECLGAFGVTDLHMKHFAHSRGQFAGWDLDQPKRRRFLSQLIGIIESHAEHVSSTSIWLDDYRFIDQTFCLHEFASPYALAASVCVGQIAEHLHDRAAGIPYYFEKGDADQSSLTKFWNEKYSHYQISPIFRAKKLKQGNIVNHVRPFEACDLIAYESFQFSKKAEKSRAQIPEIEVRRPFLRMRAFPGARQWRLFHVDDLRNLCNTNKIGLRAAP